MQQKNKWYLGLTILFLLIMVLSRRYNFDGFSVFIMIILFMIFIIYFRFRLSKGNLKKYDIASLNLIWEDKVTNEKKINQKKINFWKKLLILSCIIFILLTSPFILKYLMTEDNLFIEGVIDSPLFMLLWMSCLFLLLILIMFHIILKLTYKVQQIGEQIKVYKEGLRYLNYFIPWSDMKSLTYPKTFQLSKNVSKIIPNYYSSDSTTLKIVNRKNRIFLVELYDLKKFEEELNRLNKGMLLK